jgi:hypothetical protein
MWQVADAASLGGRKLASGRQQRGHFNDIVHPGRQVKP